VRLELATIGPMRVYFRRVEGVSMRVANDLFNGAVRTYHTAFGTHEVVARVGGPEARDLGSAWVNVDDRVGLIGICGADTWWLLRDGSRGGGYAGSILSDRLCWPARTDMHDVWGPAAVLDTGCVIVSSIDGAATESMWRDGAARRLACREDEARAVLVGGRDGVTYLLAANFSFALSTVTLEEPLPGALVDVCTGQPARCSAEEPTCLHVRPGGAVLCRVVPDPH
jgi:hypothetical protein